MRTTSSLASMERSNVSLATSHENCPCALGDCSQWAHGDIFEWAYFAGNICEHMWTWDFTRNHSVFLCAFSSWSQVFLASLVSWRHRKVAAMAKFTSRHTKQTTVIRNMMWWRTPRSVSCCSWALLSESCTHPWGFGEWGAFQTYISYMQLLSTGLRYPHAACELKIMDCRPLPPSQPRTITSSRGWRGWQVESPSSNRTKMILT